MSKTVFSLQSDGKFYGIFSSEEKIIKYLKRHFKVDTIGEIVYNEFGMADVRVEMQVMYGPVQIWEILSTGWSYYREVKYFLITEWNVK